MTRKVLSLFLLLIALSTTAMAQIAGAENFNDGWQFRRGAFASDPLAFSLALDAGKWSDVTVPHTWNARDMQTEKNNFYAGQALYRKTFTLRQEQQNKRIFIRFEGVGSIATIYINGHYIGEHKGGYSAFAFDITRALKPNGENQIIVRADNASRVDVIPTNHNLFGVYGGIYRPVWLITKNKVNITPTDHASSGVYVSQSDVSERSAQIKIKTMIDNGEYNRKVASVEHTIKDQTGKIVASTRQGIVLDPQGVRTHTAEMMLKKPRLWNGRKDPYLYKVETTLTDADGSVLDSAISPLGVRTVELRAGDGVYLNGKKYPMYGVCRHQDRAGAGSALTEVDHREDLAMILEIGATTIRLAHYQQSDFFYSLCDSAGLLVWAEIPFVNRATTQEADNAKSQLTELILQSYNHPSIYTWGLHNEVYNPPIYVRSLTRELHMLAKKLDPERYTVAVNGYGVMDHPVNLEADIQGMNRYFGWYEGKIDDMERWAVGLETNFPDQKLILAEYGAEANTAQQSELTGESYNYQSDFYPEGYATKTHERHWAIIAAHPYILASYVWNMFDFAVPMWERGGVPARNMKGLVTFDRKLRKDVFYWYKANWSAEPVFYLTERRAVNREKEQTRITVYSNVGQPTVTLNGVPVEVKCGLTAVHYTAEGVRLQKGENVIVARSADGEHEDRIVWVFRGEGDNKLINNVENRGTHAGF